MKSLMKYIAIVMTLVALLSFEVSAEGYLYNRDGVDVPIPDAYQYVGSIQVQDNTGTSALSPQDMAVSENGVIFVADTDNNRVLILGNEGNVALSEFTLPSGEMTWLRAPEGICALSDEDFLVADTNNNRILHCTAQGSVLKVIDKPDYMPGISEEEAFLPIKVDVDSAGRLYIIARNINHGLICTDENGDFISYIGAPRVTPDFFELLWRRFSTKAQLDRMTQYVSTEYNNILVDDQSFIWGTISALKSADIQATIGGGGSATPISKINSADIDVLKRNGMYPPVGDIRFSKEASQIVDVALGQNGVYSLLDYQRGHVFTYDDNGNLLFAFCELGKKHGDVQKPVALHGQQDEIWILDADLSEILIYKPTEYGSKVLSAVGAQYQGNYDAAYQLWSEVARSNSNFEFAFVGMGNAFMSDGDYQRAMSYFKFAQDTEKYSEAFELDRQEKLEVAFPYIFGGIIAVLVIWLLSMAIRRAVNYVRDVSNQVAPVNTVAAKDREGFLGKIRYAWYLTFHPFKGFYEIKVGRMGSLGVSFGIMALTVLANVMYGLYSGYLFNANNGVNFDVVKSIATTVLLIVLWCISNWCLTCLFDGEGNFLDVVRATGYALLPFALIQLLLIPLTNVLSLREAAFVGFLSGIGLLWCGFLLFTSVVVTHQYTFFKTLIMIVCVILGMCALAYLALLLFNLIQQVMGFVYVLLAELRGKL